MCPAAVAFIAQKFLPAIGSGGRKAQYQQTQKACKYQSL
jgi:hypothetical protein